MPFQLGNYLCLFTPPEYCLTTSYQLLKNKDLIENALLYAAELIPELFNYTLKEKHQA